ncbi:pentapeptide repeat protein [Leptolyngbya sp. Heron Island J]|uniref:pentapeptide repeat-containing protein n=1 Tax=Leptolyngbya sp. Heron Island J TaxID=1385935 RepID=UPI0003B9A402|nr:pentapeptide repeat-containing protein [Leptolyngbya sp. Heron Island J]ESA36555.1 pentapeptide repeat protein [Leptolyngbya sp. Heron Island J]
MGSRLWSFLTTDIRELISLETVDSSKDVAEAVLGLADVLETEGPNIQKLAPVLTQLNSLLDALNSPLGRIAEASLPFISIGTGLLRFYIEKTKKEPTIAQSVALISQAAYLETVKSFLNQPKLKSWLTKVGSQPSSELVKQKLKQLDSIELGDIEARQALLYFHESKLAKAYGEVLTTRLIDLGVKSAVATKISDKLARETNRIMMPVLVDNSGSVKKLVEWHRIGGDAVLEKYISIDTYLEECIAPRPHESVFAENFSYKDIYVPLKAQPLEKDRESNKDQKLVTLEQWAQELINNSKYSDKVIFIQGGPGRGKSVFCRMFADWVRRHEHPRWTPILIRLRDITVLSKDFEETLSKAIDRDFTRTDAGWLTDRNVNFLFLLDGFDELLMEGRTSGGLDQFLEQVGRFQERCAHNSEKGHRVLITGRTFALQSIESRLPHNLVRLNILAMDDELQAKWFHHWSKIIGSDKRNLSEALKDSRLPDRVRKLAQEPLILYLLAAMYRDGRLRLEMFEGMGSSSAKILIYDHTVDWILTKQRADGFHTNTKNQAITTNRELNSDITELAPEHLRRILQEAGLCVAQSGMEFANIQIVEDRLTQDRAVKAFLEAAQRQLETDDTPLRNALATFYLQPGRQGEGSIEFIHKSFGEFLCAERIVQSLVNISQPGHNQEYGIEDSIFHWTMYDLLGCPILTQEIVEYLIALLIQHPDFQAKRLYTRLYDFYWRWSDGEFIDAPPENLPQRKMKLLQTRTTERIEVLGQRQVDIYVGLNVIILLLELHRYGKSLIEGEIAKQSGELNNSLKFHPCSLPSKKCFSKKKLARILISSLHTIPGSFSNVLGPFLSNIDCSQADLSCIGFRELRFSAANFNDATLEGTNFSSAMMHESSFRKTRLFKANLDNANLYSADLSHATISRACCFMANFRTSNLSHAILEQSLLSGADLSQTNLQNVNFNRATLHSADLSHSNLDNASLEKTDLFAADLSSSSIQNTNCRNANFQGGFLLDTNFKNTNLMGASFRQAHLVGANFCGANLETVDFYGANLDSILWDDSTNWGNITGLENAENVSQDILSKIGIESPSNKETKQGNTTYFLLRNNKKILVLDDHKAVLAGTLSVLAEQYPDYILLSASNVQEANYLFADHQPFLFVTDLSHPKSSGDRAQTNHGLDHLKRIMTQYPKQNIVVQSAQVRSLVRLHSLIQNHLGGFGIADKALTSDKMLSVVKCVLEGRKNLGRLGEDWKKINAE